MRPNFVLFLLNRKAVTVLEAFLKCFGASPIKAIVLTQDSSISDDGFQELKNLCINYQIPYQMRKDNTPLPETDYGIAVGWRWLIHDFKGKLIVLHDSPLPKYRGFAPLVNQLISEEPMIGVTALFASDEYDRGAILGQRLLPIQYPIKIQKAIDLISSEYAELVCEVVQRLTENPLIEGVTQVEDEATYSLWRDEEDYFIPWDKDAIFIQRWIYALGKPYKGACTYMDKDLIRIHECTVLPDVKFVQRDIGKVIFMQKEKPVIVCGSGLLRIEEASYQDTQQSIFPLKKFRIRFRSNINFF